MLDKFKKDFFAWLEEQNTFNIEISYYEVGGQTIYTNNKMMFDACPFAAQYALYVQFADSKGFHAEANSLGQWKVIRTFMSYHEGLGDLTTEDRPYHEPQEARLEAQKRALEVLIKAYNKHYEES